MYTGQLRKTENTTHPIPPPVALIRYALVCARIARIDVRGIVANAAAAAASVRETAIMHLYCTYTQTSANKQSVVAVADVVVVHFTRPARGADALTVSAHTHAHTHNQPAAASQPKCMRSGAFVWPFKIQWIYGWGGVDTRV